MNIWVTPKEEALILKESTYFGDKWGYIDTKGDNKAHLWPAAVLARSRGSKISRESWQDDDGQELELLTLLPVDGDEEKTMIQHLADLVKHWGFTTDTTYLQCLMALQKDILDPKQRAEWIQENQYTHPANKER